MNLRSLISTCFFLFCFSSISAQENRISSKIDSTMSPELVLIQEFTVDASVQEVWDAYTTKEGYEHWAVPLAEFDLRVGGTIKTNYDPNAQIDDSSTIVTHIINYVPQKLLTLQAEISPNFPEFMKEDAEDFFNVIYFNELKDGQTHIQSFGIGYKNDPQYLSLMDFFISANEKTLMNLIAYLEKDQK